MKMSYVTLDRFLREHAAKDDSLSRKLEADTGRSGLAPIR
jgi:hypothetical protein